MLLLLCRDSNSQPFNHESGVLINKLSGSYQQAIPLLPTSYPALTNKLPHPSTEGSLAEITREVGAIKENVLFKAPLRLIRDWEKGVGGGMGTYILPKNDHQNDNTLGWASWHLVFNVSTVVRNKVTKTVSEKQLLRTTPAIRESNPTSELPPHLLCLAIELSCGVRLGFRI